MRAGTLNRRIALLRQAAPVDNGYEEMPGGWQLLGHRMASVKVLPRREGGEGEGKVARREISLWLRHDSLTRTLTAEDALVHEGALYQLQAEPAEIGRREGVELIAVTSTRPNAEPLPVGV